MISIASTTMHLKTIARLLAVSAVIVTASPALATQVSHHDGRSQTMDFCDNRTCTSHEIDAPHWNGGETTHDNWPNNMILG